MLQKMTDKRAQDLPLIGGAAHDPADLGDVQVGAEELKNAGTYRSHCRPVSQHHGRDGDQLTARISHGVREELVADHQPAATIVLPPQLVPERPGERRARRNLFVERLPAARQRRECFEAG